MPRKSRIDAPGALHHVIGRGINRKKIFKDDFDRNNFLDRLGNLLKATGTSCFAWALPDNHFHLLLRTGTFPISTLMRRLLTGYAISFNRRHNKCGHLFQNRYKSVLCQEEPYLLELVRYIHLNPLRAKIIPDMDQLYTYPFSGHSVLMGKQKNDWQDTGYILQRFGKRVSNARREYLQFVQNGIDLGKRPELVGGGLVRSMGGWSAVKASRRKKAYIKGDERILGEGDFVEDVLARADEAMQKKYQAISGLDLDKAAQRVGQIYDMTPEEVWGTGKRRRTVNARSLLCYWAVRELRISMTELARRLNISITSIGKSVSRGEELVKSHRYTLN